MVVVLEEKWGGDHGDRKIFGFVDILAEMIFLNKMDDGGLSKPEPRLNFIADVE